MNVLLADAKKLLKEEIKGKSSYQNFMNLIRPMYKYIDQQIHKLTKEDGVTLRDVYFISLRKRLNDIAFDVRSLKKEVAYNNGIIDFGNVDTYDDYAIEDIFKNTHIMVETLKSLN